MLHAGVIGLGQIGGGVALCLARAGSLAAVYDVRPDAADKLEGVPACAASPAAVGRACDVVVIAVVSAEQALSVLTGEEGLLAAARPGLSVVLLSTVSLESLRELSRLVTDAGAMLIDCGVTGGPAAATGGLTCLVGGEEADVARVRPVLESFSQAVFHMGPPAAGMAAKIARNVIVFGSIRVGYEAELLARAAGIDVAQLAALVDQSTENVLTPTSLMKRPSPASDPAERKVREMVLELMKKDLEAAQSLAAELGVRVPVADISHDTAAKVLGLESE